MVLPEPLLPRSSTTSPWRSSIDTPSSTTCPPNDFLSPWARITTGGAPALAPVSVSCPCALSVSLHAVFAGQPLRPEVHQQHQRQAVDGQPQLAGQGPRQLGEAQ